MSSQTVYLVSGANRGIGLGLVTVLASRPNVVVFAGARDPSKAVELDALVKKCPGVVHILKLVSADEEGNRAAVAEIEKKVGRLDVVIANAGISEAYGPVATAKVEDFKKHYEVNTLGPLVLFQSSRSLLLQSKQPTFALISTIVGSIGSFYPAPVTAYGSSKVAANFIMRALHAEHEKENLCVVSIHPGLVDTDMGKLGLKSLNVPLEKAPVSIEQAVDGILNRLDGATRETSGDKFYTYKAIQNNPLEWPLDEIPW